MLIPVISKTQDIPNSTPAHAYSALGVSSPRRIWYVISTAGSAYKMA